MRSPYDDFSVVSDNEANSNNNNNSAIPYHARENSLPFSYGQISKTSTPLRKVNTQTGTGTSDRGRYRSNIDDFGYGLGSSSVRTSTTKADGNFGLSDDNYYGTNCNNNDNNILTATLKSTTKPTTGSTGSTNNTIKAQPRLTSPILVRKTLNSRSPTRNGSTANTNANHNTNTNTIANTYHYKYGSSDNDSIFGVDVGRGSSSGRDNTLNGNINGYGSNKKYTNNNSSSNNFDYGGGGDTIDGSVNVRKTQPRDDFEELLRERREKVMRDHYRSAGSIPTNKSHGIIGGGGGGGAGLSPNSSRKFNYDFEFHLNLDDDNGVPQPPRRAHTIDRMSLQQQQQQHRTRDIPVQVARELEVVTPTLLSNNATYVERNYHTISNSNGGSRDAQQQQLMRPQLQQHQQQPQRQQQFESLYSTVEKRTVQQPQQQLSQRRQYSPSLSPSPSPIQQQQQRRIEYTTYGNVNASGYGYDSDNATTTTNNRSSLGAAVVARSRNDLSSPIYATTTKQVTTSMNTYGSRNTFEPELSITDHPSLSYGSGGGGGMSSNVAMNAVATTTTGGGKISPSPSSQHQYQQQISTHTIIRPETPAFPVTPRTPHSTYTSSGQNSPMGYSYSHSPLPQQRSNLLNLSNGKSMLDLNNYSSETVYRTSCRPRLDSNMSIVNSEPQEVAAHLVKFAKDSSKYWYKPNLSREEAVQLLLHAEPGTFIVRNSTTYKDNYGLVVRVHQPPPNSELTGQPDDLVRHFLIEPTKHGVRLKSCANEPVFTSLSALIYEHSINKLALPCLLRIPDHDLVPSLIEPTSAQKQLLTQGAACNVLWLFSCETESLTGEEAIRKAIRQLYAQQPLPVPTEVHFKVTQQGITLTDNTRKKFFRKHYPGDSISFCAIDPDHRLWSMQLSTEEDGNAKNSNKSTAVGGLKKTIFAFVARSSPKSKDNQCHVFCDLDIHQPASAIVSFVNKTLPTEKERNFVL